jgi:hypothetical protein
MEEVRGDDSVDVVEKAVERPAPAAVAGPIPVL